MKTGQRRKWYKSTGAKGCSLPPDAKRGVGGFVPGASRECGRTCWHLDVHFWPPQLGEHIFLLL